LDGRPGCAPGKVGLGIRELTKEPEAAERTLLSLGAKPFRAVAEGFWVSLSGGWSMAAPILFLRATIARCAMFVDSVRGVAGFRNSCPFIAYKLAVYRIRAGDNRTGKGCGGVSFWCGGKRGPGG
jgi:hypothetical protein